jgi:hypothetical protein
MRLFLIGSSIVFLLACGSDAPTATLPGVSPQIDVRYTSSGIPPAVASAVSAAQARWTRAVSKDLGAFRFNTPANDCFQGEPALNETHGNLLVFISVGQIDGRSAQLAYTQICRVSQRDTLPTLSHIRIDIADVDSLEARGTLAGVIMHEMGHALGFEPDTYVAMRLSGGGADDPYFGGVTSRAEFTKHGAWYTGVTVPLENSSGHGPLDPHWRFIVFGDELMVPVVGRGFKSPLSSITLGFFQDIGYQVDFSAADPYEVVPLFGGDRVLPVENLRNDFRSIAPPKFVSPLVER